MTMINKFKTLCTMMSKLFAKMMAQKATEVKAEKPKDDEYPNKLGSIKKEDEKEEEKPTATVGKQTSLTVVDSPNPSAGKSLTEKKEEKDDDKNPDKHWPVIKTGHSTQHGLGLPAFDKRVGIRLGDDTNYSRLPDIMINTISSVDNTKDKKKMKQMLHKAGVSTPPVIFFPTEENLPVIYKPHTRNHDEGLQLVYSMTDLRNCVSGMGTYEEILKVDTEYRVHVIGGKAFFMDEKVAGNSVSCDIVRNTKTGYTYRWREDSVPDVVKEEAIKAVAALDLDLAAVDVGYIDGKAYVYEVSTGISMRDTTKKKYKEAITNYVLSKDAKILK